MASDIFAPYRGRGGRFAAMFRDVPREARDARGRFVRGWPTLLNLVTSEVVMRGLSTEYKLGTGRSRWAAKGQRAHRTMWNIKWDIRHTDPRLLAAAARVVNRTMFAAVHVARENHRGWQNRTGRAERSIKITRHATPLHVTGQWGSDGSAYYFLFLELKYATLRAAADEVYSAKDMTKQLVLELKKSGWGAAPPLRTAGFRAGGRAPFR